MIDEVALEQLVVELQTRNAQLETALASRIVIEQAKGVVAERQGVDMEQAFATLRNHARNHNLRLAELAGDTVTGTVDPAIFDR